MSTLTPYDYQSAVDSEAFARVLDVFETPKRAASRIAVKHVCEEFSHLCPFTGHPDYGTIEIAFRAGNVCVELKSLKLYLQQYRDLRIPYEAVVPTIFGHLAALLYPGEALRADSPVEAQLCVRGVWRGRGGIRSEVHQGDPGLL